MTRSSPAMGRRSWSPQDDALLRCYWGVRPDAWVAAKLGRTAEACKIRATRFLRQNRAANAGMGAGDVGRLFAVDPTTVTGLWVSRGWVPARRSAVGAGLHQRWSFSGTALRRFVTEFPWAYDPARMLAGHWLTGLAAEIHAADPWLTVGDVAALLHYHREMVRRWVRAGRLPHQRRPNYGQNGGPHGGRIVVRRSDALAFPARLEAETRANRSAAARLRSRRYGLPNGAWPRMVGGDAGDAVVLDAAG